MSLTSGLYNLKIVFFLGVFFIFNHNPILAQKSSIELSGDIFEIALPVAAFISTFKYNNKYDGSIQFVKSMGTTMIVTYALKYSINKTRPNGGELGFPSGHTASAFTGAAFIERRYGWKFGAPAYLIASFVGWSRIHSEKHDIWDVLGGATIGIVSTYLFTKPYKNLDMNIGINYLKLEYHF